jgi:hypothetical protein
MKYHKIEHQRLIEHTQYAKKGRPTANTPVKASRFQIQASIAADQHKITEEQQKRSCFVLATNEMDEEQLSNEQVLAGYKAQSSM